MRVSLLSHNETARPLCICSARVNAEGARGLQRLLQPLGSWGRLPGAASADRAPADVAQDLGDEECTAQVHPAKLAEAFVAAAAAAACTTVRTGTVSGLKFTGEGAERRVQGGHS